MEKCTGSLYLLENSFQTIVDIPLRQSPRFPPHITFPLSVGRTCDNDGVSLPRVAWKKFARQSLRDFANVIKVSNQLILSPSKGILSSLSRTLSGELLRKSKGSEG